MGADLYMNKSFKENELKYKPQLDKKIEESSWKTYDPNFIKPEALKYLEQSAEAGYLIAMSNLIGIYSAKSNFDTSNGNQMTKSLGDKSLTFYKNNKS